MTYEHTVFDAYPLANKSVAGNLAAPSHTCVLLDFNEGADLCIVSYLATIEVDESGEFDIVAKPDVGGDAQEVAAHASATALIGLQGVFALSRTTASLLFLIDCEAAPSILTPRRPAAPALTELDF